MQASDIMTHEVVAATPEAAGADLARLMMEHRISAVPIVRAGELVAS